METKVVDGLNVVTLGAGEAARVMGRGGWVYELAGTENGADVVVKNPVDLEGGSVGEKFFTFSTVGNPYGAGMVLQETTLGIDISKLVEGANGKLVGAVVLDEDNRVTGRFSWSNVVYMKKLEVELTSEGELLIGGVSHGFLCAIFLADKNRISGYVGVFVPTKPKSPVKVLEMETLVIASAIGN